jgi:hypothetical protein
VFCYLNPLPHPSQPPPEILLRSFTKAKVQHLVINDNIFSLYTYLYKTFPGRKLVDVEVNALGALLESGTVKALTIVRGHNVSEAIGSQEVILKILGRDWRACGFRVPPSFEELKEGRKWTWNENVSYGQLEKVT